MTKTKLILLNVFMIKSYLAALCKGEEDFNENRKKDGGPSVYEILDKMTAVGKGSYGQVFSVKWDEDKSGPIYYAVKIQEKISKHGPKAITLFEQEISYLIEMSEKGEKSEKIEVDPQFIDCYEDEELIFVVMELLPCSFDKLIGEDKDKNTIKNLCDSSFVNFPGEIKFLYIKDMMIKLRELHRNHLVHHDIKPANMGLASKDFIGVKFLDFGLMHKEKDQFYGGTHIYMHPLKILHSVYNNNGKKFDQIDQEFLKHGFRKSDVWSLALTIYRLLSSSVFSKINRKCLLSEKVAQYLTSFIEKMHEGKWIKKNDLELCYGEGKNKVCFSNVIKSMTKIEYGEIEEMENIVAKMEDIHEANKNQISEANDKFMIKMKEFEQKEKMNFKKLSKIEQEEIIKNAQALLYKQKQKMTEDKNLLNQDRLDVELSEAEQKIAEKCLMWNFENADERLI